MDQKMRIFRETMVKLWIWATISVLIFGLVDAQGNGPVRPPFSKHPVNTFLRSRGPKPRPNAPKKLLPPPPPPPPRRPKKADLPEERPLNEAQARSIEDDKLQAPPLPKDSKQRPGKVGGRVSQRPIPKLGPLRRPPPPPRIQRPPLHHSHRRPVGRPPLPPLPQRHIQGLRRLKPQKNLPQFLRPPGPLLPFDAEVRPQQIDAPDPIKGVPNVFKPSPQTSLTQHITAHHANPEHSHDHSHDHGHDHSHHQSPDHSNNNSNDHNHQHSNDHSNHHSHNHSNDHSHDHGHDHSHDHSHDRSHDHGQNQSHDHIYDHGHDHHHIHNDHQHGGLDLEDHPDSLQVPPVDDILLTPDVTQDTLTTAAPLPVAVSDVSNGLDHRHHDDASDDHHHHHHHHKKDESIDLNLLGPDFVIRPRGHSSPVFGSKVQSQTTPNTTTSTTSLPLVDAVPATPLKNLRPGDSRPQPRSNSFFLSDSGLQQPEDLSASDSQVNQRLAFGARETKDRTDRHYSHDPIDNSVDNGVHVNRRIDDVTEMVDCGGRDLGFCDMNSRYPGHMMGNLMSDCQELVYKGFVPVPEDLEELGDNEPLAMYSNASKSAVRAQRGSWSWKPYTYEKKQVCSSELRFIRPGYARDSTGKWQVIVQTEDLPQRVAIDLCHEPQQPCHMMSDCGFKSRCVQRYTFQHLLAVDPNNLHDCPTIRAFKFPAACVCHVEFVDHQRSGF